jgi:PAS domain S-box-containing protein
VSEALGPGAAHDRERSRLIFTALIEAADQAGMCICVSYAETTNPLHVNLIYVNEGTARLLGYSVAEIEVRSVWSLFAPEQIGRVVDMQARRMRGEPAPRVFDSEVMHKDGHRIPVEIATTPVTLEGQRANVTFLIDVSHRRNAEEALRRSEARFRSLIENAPDGIAIARWPKVVFVNPAAAHMLGFRDPQEAIGRDLLTLMTPSDAERADRRVGDIKRGTRPPGRAEYRSHDPDGNELSVEISAIPIEYEGAPAIMAFARDVTERKAMLAQLMAADKLAAVGTLAAGVAHEINNPLAYLLLNLEFLIRELPRLVDDGPKLEPMLRRLRETKQGAERVKTIVRDLQTFTRRDDGIRGPVDLAAVIEAALHMARHEIRHRASIVKRFEPIPPVHGNVTRFEQLFLNLLINAAHAVAELDPSRNTIEITINRGADDSVIATVRDNGIGISREVLARVFDPFFTTKPNGVGTGLGLPICQGIVAAAGGDIRIDSVEGEGSVVTVTLCVHTGEAPQPRSATPMPFAAVRQRRGRVLLIDDEPAVAEAMAMALSDQHDVVTVMSAAQARELIAAGEHFDVVLCDLVMPGETGMTLYEHVRKTRPELAPRFAFITGGSFLPETDRFLQTVDNLRIDKPFDVKALLLLIHRMLERQT